MKADPESFELLRSAKDSRSKEILDRAVDAAQADARVQGGMAYPSIRLLRSATDPGSQDALRWTVHDDVATNGHKADPENLRLLRLQEDDTSKALVAYADRMEKETGSKAT